MKGVILNFNCDNIKIPLSYHHQLQSLIYNILKKGGLFNIHDNGTLYGNRIYKLFTFSTLSGGILINKNLLFKKSLFFEIRAVDNQIINTIIETLNNDPIIEFFKQKLTYKFYKNVECNINSEDIIIETLSPINIHKTTDNHIIDLSPYDDEFPIEINNNLKRKYIAYMFCNPSTIKIEPIKVKKYITLFKKNNNIYILGYRGIFRLQGDISLLKFLFYSGIGARNSSGFGMFKVIKAL